MGIIIEKTRGIEQLFSVISTKDGKGVCISLNDGRFLSEEFFYKVYAEAALDSYLESGKIDDLERFLLGVDLENLSVFMTKEFKNPHPDWLLSTLSLGEKRSDPVYKKEASDLSKNTLPYIREKEIFV